MLLSKIFLSSIAFRAEENTEPICDGRENRRCLADSKRPGKEESKKYEELDAPLPRLFSIPRRNNKD
jgi:hypothetical protein